MRSALVAAALLLGACELTAVQDANAKLELLRRLAESSSGEETHHAAAGDEDEHRVFSPSGAGGKQDAQNLPPRPSAGDSAVLVATVRSQLSNFGSNWRKHNMAEAATALRQAGSALSQLQRAEVQQHGSADPAASVSGRSAGTALEAIANTCSEYAD